MKLYKFKPSGNSYKAHLLLQQLGQPYEAIELDVMAGASRTDAFLKKNPNGKIPTLELDDGRTLWESNAILWYLADGTDFLSDDPWERAKTLQWMSFEQHNIEVTIAEARFLITFKGKNADDVAERIERGHRALGILDAKLADRDFMVGGKYSIADIALYGYTHVAEEGHVSLADYPNVRAWIKRVEGTPNFLKMADG